MGCFCKKLGILVEVEIGWCFLIECDKSIEKTYLNRGRWTSKMTLIEFYRLLDGHDWYYPYDDDHRVWEDGNKINDKIQVIKHSSAEHLALYENFLKHKFSGSPWGTRKAPKPEIPKDNKNG